mmetsp:Transcript_31988/g.94111  ORF Transcript_31988/g.94111 Transcript_31988/m.94111 type:complete len:366 (-) Transcript_31988:3305-4402(-)
MLHGGKILQILARLEVAALVLVQEAKATVLDGQPNQLQSGLIAPLVHLGHRYIVKEDGHLLSVGRAKVLATPLVELGFDGVLRHTGSGGRGKVDALRQHPIGILAGQEHELRTGLGGTLGTNDQHRDALLVDVLDNVHGPGGIHGRNEEVGEVQLLVLGTGPSRGRPLLPLTSLRIDKVLEDGLALSLNPGHNGLVGIARSEPLVKLEPIAGLEQSPDAPAQTVDKVPFHVGPEFLVPSTADIGGILALGQSLIELREARDATNSALLHHLGAVARQEFEAFSRLGGGAFANPLGNQFSKNVMPLGIRTLPDPRLNDGGPIQIGITDVNDAGSGNGGRRGIDQGLHLEHHLDIVRHGDAISVGQR